MKIQTAIVLNFNIFNSLVLTGIVQGIVFAIVVAASKKYRFPGTLILAAFILSFSLDNLQYYLADIGLITDAEFWTIYFIPFEFLSGPLFLIYGLFVLEPERKLSKNFLLLFIPFIAALVISSWYKVIHALALSTPDFEAFYEPMENLLEYCAVVFDVSVLSYLYVKVIKNDEKFGSKHLNPQLHWFRIVLIWLFGLILIWFGVTVLDSFYNTEYWYLVYISMSGVIYWMGHVGIYKYGIYEERKQIRKYSIKHEIAPIREKPKNEHILALDRLIIGNRMFLDANLTLDKVADELAISKSHLSRIINSELGIGFPDYVNSLRVQEAKKYLTNPDFSNYTLVAIGLEAGFNSKTTFNNAFKKTTGCTPSEFKNNLAISPIN